MSPFTQMYSRLVRLWYCGLYPWSFYCLSVASAASLVSRVHSDCFGAGMWAWSFLAGRIDNITLRLSLQLFLLTILFSSIPCFLLLNKCLCRVLAPSGVVLLTASTDLPDLVTSAGLCYWDYGFAALAIAVDGFSAQLFRISLSQAPGTLTLDVILVCQWFKENVCADFEALSWISHLKSVVSRQSWSLSSAP